MAPPASKEAAPSADVPVKPAFALLNFLDDQGAAKYSASTLPKGLSWDTGKGQLASTGLEVCEWLGGRERTFSSRPGHTFRFVRCGTGDARVEGWLNQAAIKPR